ncbi:MAG: hypothetical protein ACYDA0_07970 [Candidatus Dormibacteraceae bacterium]
MQERSEEQIISRLFELENSGEAERRTELSEERYLSLIHDPDRARAYVFQHGTDETEGAEVPPGTEFWEYPTLDEAARAYEQLLAESGRAGEVVEEDSDEGIGDSETDGAEVRDRYSASDEDLLIENEETEDSSDAVS